MSRDKVRAWGMEHELQTMERSNKGDVAMTSTIEPTVVSLETDLTVVTHLEDLIHTAGGRSVIVQTPAAFVAAMDRYFAVLALVDLASVELGMADEWAGAIARCKASPQTKQTPIYAFGTNVADTTWQAVRQAGVDQLWTQSKMMDELRMVVDTHINPPIRYPIGWDDPLSDAARQGLEEFNRGDYFEQHEFLEAAWKAETRPIRDLYQGILQIGLAFLQIERGNWQGAHKMFRRGLPKLWRLPPRCQGIELATFCDDAALLYAELMSLGPNRLPEFDQHRFPQIHTIEHNV